MIFLSLGAGVQSTVMALLADENRFGEKPDYAIFADTGWEPVAVYEHLEWLKTQLSYPVVTVSAGNIRSDSLTGIEKQSRFASMPLFLKDGGMGRRQCTFDYKIQPIRKGIRRLLKVKARERIKESHIQWLGISTDEIQRMKDSGMKWLVNQWPLIDIRMSRDDCLAWFARHYPDRQLIKSACVACPYKNNHEWNQLTADEFKQAVEFDNAMRNHSKMRLEQYVHRDRKPLSEVDLSRPEDHGQISFLDECDGMCGV